MNLESGGSEPNVTDQPGDLGQRTDLSVRPQDKAIKALAELCSGPKEITTLRVPSRASAKVTHHEHVLPPL